jgi:hypothetical protein
MSIEDLAWAILASFYLDLAIVFVHLLLVVGIVPSHNVVAAVVEAVPRLGFRLCIGRRGEEY